MSKKIGLKFCIYCGKDISYVRGYRIYCNDCRWIKMKEVKVEYRERTRESKVTKAQRKWLLRDFNYTCVDCSKISDRLEIHHVTYDSNAVLVPLCKHCHSMRHKRNAIKEF